MESGVETDTAAMEGATARATESYAATQPITKAGTRVVPKLRVMTEANAETTTEKVEAEAMV